MKITREKPEEKFIPITIVLESEAEARAVWHRLNNNEDLNNYCVARKILKSSINSGALWEALSKVYNPENGRK